MSVRSFYANNKYIVKSKVVILNYNYTNITYFDLRFCGSTRNGNIIENFDATRINRFDYEFDIKKETKEETIDFLCGNIWPEYMEEFLQLIIQELV